MEKNRCAYLGADHRFTLREEPVPTPGPEEALVRVEANGICGSDIHFYAEGRLGNFVVTDPYVPGHEAAGVVQAVGAGVQGLAPGQRVVIEPGIPCGRCQLCHSGKYNLCPSVRFLSVPGINGTFCDYLCVRSDFLHPMPDGLSFAQGAMVEPAAVAVHAVNQAIAAGSIAGKQAVVLGSGPIGIMVLQAWRAMGGGAVTCTDVMDKRLEMAKRLGADETVNSRSQALPNGCADVVLETAGLPQTTAQMPSLARPGGTMVQVGWPAGNLVQLNVADIIEKELTYKSVNRYANAFPAAIRYIADGRINADAMITQTYKLADIAEAFAFAHDNPADTLKVAVVNR